jgi:Mn2+/Fe2+ NRAMP family transporter
MPVLSDPRGGPNFLHNHGKTSIQSAAQTAEALKPFVGQSASAIFALGFIGSGLLAIPVLAGVVFIGR